LQNNGEGVAIYQPPFLHGINMKQLTKSESYRASLINAIDTKATTSTEDKVAYVGLALVQGSLLPSHFIGTMPHFSLPLGICLGLLCYQYRAWKQNDMVYTIGNLIGLALNGSMLIRIIL
tara:strand:+ start:604 stop:963 length:360 start_codon:yes stop_codon:yes gene_type:complete